MLCLYKWRSRLWSLRIDHLSTCFYLGYAHRSRRGPQLSTLDRVPTSFDRYLGNSLAYSKARRTVPTVGTYGRGDTPSKKSYRGTPFFKNHRFYRGAAERQYSIRANGWVWFKAPILKVGIVILSWVRIPLCPRRRCLPIFISSSSVNIYILVVLHYTKVVLLLFGAQILYPPAMP